MPNENEKVAPKKTARKKTSDPNSNPEYYESTAYLESEKAMISAETTMSQLEVT